MRYNLFGVVLIVLFLSCAHQGLITEKYAPDFYEIPKLLEDGPFDKNPSFIVYGDNRPGYRIQENFFNKNNWQTWKMLIFPFYEIYWLGNGLYGTVNFLRHTPGYGISNHRDVRDIMLSEVKNGQIDFLINIGDMPTDGRRPNDQILAASLIDYKKQGLDVQAVKNEKVYHYCKVSVNPFEITVEVYSAPGGKEKSSRLIEKIIIKNDVSD